MTVKRSRRGKGVCVAALSAGCFSLGLAGASATAAPSIYLDKNGASTGSGVTASANYSWEASVWSTSSTGVTVAIPFTEGDFARFAAGTDAGSKSYSVTASSDHTIGGMFLQTNGGGTVTVNGPGTLTIDPTGGPIQGFLVSGSSQSLVINAKLAGTGGVEQEDSGQISLFGNNSYSGGTLTTGGQVLNYNNNNSFGTGTITTSGSSGQGLVNSGAAGVTIGNNVVLGSGTTTNFASGAGTVAAPGAIWSGSFTLPASGTVVLQTGGTGQVTAITGIISGGNGVNVSQAKNSGGTMVFSGANSYSGATTVTGATVLVLGASGTIASSSSVVLAGGTLDPHGLTQAMAATTLAVSANSTIDFSAGAAEVDFGNSTGQSWSGTLNLLNFDPAVDTLRFGSDNGGLTAGQLSAIQFNGSTPVGLHLDSTGAIAVPEPGTAALLLLGGPLLLGGRRRRAC